MHISVDSFIVFTFAVACFWFFVGLGISHFIHKSSSDGKFIIRENENGPYNIPVIIKLKGEPDMSELKKKDKIILNVVVEKDDENEISDT